MYSLRLNFICNQYRGAALEMYVRSLQSEYARNRFVIIYIVVLHLNVCITALAAAERKKYGHSMGAHARMNESCKCYLLSTENQLYQ